MLADPLPVAAGPPVPAVRSTRHDNAFGFLRLLFASMVIAAHSLTIVAPLAGAHLTVGLPHAIAGLAGSAFHGLRDRLPYSWHVVEKPVLIWAKGLLRRDVADPTRLGALAAR